jgi:predicted transcriptional regulator
MSDGPEEVIDTASKRATFLSAIASGPKSKPDLRDELGLSRSTVYKAVRELEHHDLVERTDDGFALTIAGRHVESAYREFHDRVADVCQAQELLAILPRDCDLPSELLADAEVVAAERHAPNHPLQQFEEMVATADTVRGISPVALPRYVELFHEQAVVGEVSTKLVLEQPVVRYLLTDYGDQFEAATTSPYLSIRETEETLPFGLIVVEGESDGVAVVVYDDRGELRGIVTNDAPAAVEWGLETFERYDENAVELGGN